MKRALAERAKQSAGLPSNGTIMPTQRRKQQLRSVLPEPEADSRPIKIPRRRYSDNTAGSSALVSAPAPAPGLRVGSSSAQTQQQQRQQEQQQPQSPPHQPPQSPRQNQPQLPLVVSSSSSVLPDALSSSSSRLASERERQQQHHSTSIKSTRKIPSSSPDVTNASSSLKRQRGAGASTSSSLQFVKSERNNSNSNSTRHDDEEDEDDDEENLNNSVFFLRHQNRALASELKTYQFQLRRLERERDYRRKQCSMACQALNSLQATWTQMETSLHQHQHYQQQTGYHRTKKTSASSSSLSTGSPMSTGVGMSVELIGALFDALANLATTATNRRNHSMNYQDEGDDENMDDEDDDDHDDEDRTSSRPAQDDLDPAEKQQLEALSSISRNVLQRATTLENWIWSLLQKLASFSKEESLQHQIQHQKSSKLEKRTNKSKDGDGFSLQNNRLLIKELAELKGRCRENKVKIDELSKAREDIATSDRKVRRSLYRLSAGRIKIEEVMNDLEKFDEDGHFAAEAKMEALAAQAAAAAVANNLAKELGDEGEEEDLLTSEGASTKKKKRKGEQCKIADGKLKNKISDLEKAVANRDERLVQLNNSLIEKEKRINELSAKQLSEEDSKKVHDYEKTLNRLKVVEKDLAEVYEKLEITRGKWSQAIADKKLALKTVDELQKKQNRRWAELVGDSHSTVADAVAEAADASVDAGTKAVRSGLVPANQYYDQSKQIIELEHKLSQALENVRQADIIRQNLKEALSMNQTLQLKLDEIKGKYAALQTQRSSSGGSSSRGGDHSYTSGSSTPREKSSSSYSSSYSGSSSYGDKSDSAKLEKLSLQYRKLRKELASATVSKDTAKQKLERAEKMRDSLMEANSRLLKQSAEKDDMNAQSLDNILHLKNLTEQLNLEKANIEKQSKSSMQLALAARLAANAKDRVAEEFGKEKKHLEENLEKVEKQREDLKKKLEALNEEYSEADSKSAKLKSKLEKSFKRNNELVTHCSKIEEEKLKLRDSLDVALRKVMDGENKVKELSLKAAGGNFNTSGGTGGGANSPKSSSSNFTVEQLNTQVSVLQGRLECPVCHYRDKDCIILRCRHMFCRHCVDENIQNRSRKCPSCGLKFSEKDVKGVWL